MRDVKFIRIFHQDFENHRMQMEMQVAVDVVKRQAGGAEFLKLRVDFGAERLAQTAPEKIFHPGADGRIAEGARGIDEAGNFSGR